jgi:pyruvate,water dikinase
MAMSRAIAEQPHVVPLDDAHALASVLGAKAANLARARAAGLPVIDGFVIPPGVAAHVVRAPRGERTEHVEVVRRAWGELSRRGSEPVVVRSSSTAEDTAGSSQAGVFESVVDVRGWDDFLDAVAAVAASGHRAAGGAATAPLAVLVQRHVDPARSGIMFTADPVSGRHDRIVLATVDGGPQGLVSGTTSGQRVVLDRHARVVEGRRRDAALGAHERRAVVRLAKRAEALFGGPQDIEWAIAADGRALLLQSRPITRISGPTSGPLLGPGPVAETFPDPLQPLEQDLWLVPLADALRIALELTGGAPKRALAQSPVVVTVGGRAAVDLDLVEGHTGRRRGLALLDPRPPVRRLRVAWQVGRLRSSLPGLVDDLVAGVDRELASVPAPDALPDHLLLRLLDRGRTVLRAVHGYEVLAGTLASSGGMTGADLALAELLDGRRAGSSDADVVAARPVVLALVPPAITGRVDLPPTPDLALQLDAARSQLGPREVLRLRIRWVQELMARVAWILGVRLTARGVLLRPEAVAGLDLASLRRAVRDHAVVDPDAPRLDGPPLPARFRLDADGSPVAVHDGAREGVGAGGGRRTGVVAHGKDPAPGTVLVVDTLDPRLAPVLPRLAGLVAATGSPLSHLAILAREHGVATVVGVPDATQRYAPGTELLVDGSTGEVQVIAAPEDQR